MIPYDYVQMLCNNITKEYSKEYNNATINIRNYIQLLIIETIENKNNKKIFHEMLKILNFLEEKFKNDREGFDLFIKKLNKFKNTKSSHKIIENILKEELNYDGGLF